MTSSPSTLHDFVLNLLADPSARAAFEADAEGALDAAGLSDITAVDVQEVIPLVLDLAPSTGLPAVDSVQLHGLPEEVLAAGPAGAISQLQAVTEQLSTSSLSLSEINVSSVGVLAADEDGLWVWGGAETAGLADTFAAGQMYVSGDFSAVGDATSTLEDTAATATGTAGTAVGTATDTVDSVSGTAGSLIPGTDSVFGTVDTLTGLVDGVSGQLSSGDVSLGTTLDVAGLGQSGTGEIELHGTNSVGEVVDTATGVVNGAGLTGVVSNVTDVADVANLPAVDGLGVTDLLF